MEYLENFYNLLVRVQISDEIALSFFLSSLNVELEKSVCLHKQVSTLFVWQDCKKILSKN